MNHIPLRRRPLEKGRGRVYRDRMSGQWFADYRAEDGLLHGVWASDIADGNEWCLGKVATVGSLADLGFAALAYERDRREAPGV